MIKNSLKKFFRDIAFLFVGRNLVWQIIAVGITYILVISGVDWWVVNISRELGLRQLAGPAGMIGFFMPFVFPICFWAIGWMRKNKRLLIEGVVIAQAEITAFLLALLYKALTGRPGPSGFGLATDTGMDISHLWRFGWLRGGVFWGWPSSHIIVAIAGAVTIMILYWREPVVRYLALAYGMYIFLSVSVSFHWLSDGIAGLIFGVIIGLAVTRSAKGGHS